jgi:hypothetical protein
MRWRVINGYTCQSYLGSAIARPSVHTDSAPRKVNTRSKGDSLKRYLISLQLEPVVPTSGHSFEDLPSSQEVNNGIRLFDRERAVRRLQVPEVQSDYGVECGRRR